MDSASTRRAGRVIASPRARRALRERGIDPAAVRGSGPGGRIVEADVPASASSAPSGSVGTSTATSQMRRAIARRTSESAATIPHFYVQAEADATALIALRARIAPQIEREHAVKPTITDFLLRAMALALAEQPRANRVWRDDGLVALDAPAVGLVVGLDDGLAIPVIAPAATLHATARLRAAAVARARVGQTLAAMPCATSLSNLGAGRVDAFTAIIPLGQSSILAAGRAAPRPWAVGDALTVRTTMRLCLSADHRVFDGQPAADFLGRIVELIESPGPLAP